MSALPKTVKLPLPATERTRERGVKQAYDLRDLAAKQALAIDSLPESKEPREVLARAQSVLALIRAWESATDRVRILRGVPLPGSRRPAPQRPQRQSLRPLAQWNEQPAEPTGKTKPLDQAPEHTEPAD